ncbi:MAG: SDR family oxidoreductase [Aestuariivita sp.]|nr:SDR family oxidoreductase [Aestuariivita sp.]MCY4202146.1 SDR family oxidoreductase [Aestuariivita sp.]MCY4289591.1 SDR family oxidoreductase [Aestuariivita sp.]MCY4347906.1 SDR family oxidoreductase [Aestuariivita sp.]
MKKSLLCIGFGYCASAAARLVLSDGWSVFGTARKETSFTMIRETGTLPVTFPSAHLREVIRQTSHLLLSAAPIPAGDPVLLELYDAIKSRASEFDWVGYLSTTGVYGNHDGGWVDETTPTAPTSERAEQRRCAETEWHSIPDLPVHIFRLAGIYGPDRNPFNRLRNGTAQRVIKPHQQFNRVHVDDIAAVLVASMKRPSPTAIYNVCDDEPAPPQDVIEYAARLINLPVPPDIPFSEANLSAMAKSFFADNKRVRNDKTKRELGVTLKHPNYRIGLRSILGNDR